MATIVQLIASLAATMAQTSEASSTGQLQTHDLDLHPSARCLDGSPGGFYVRRAQTSSRGATTWVLVFEGGGECTSESTCSPRTHSHLGSSNYFPPNVIRQPLQCCGSGREPGLL